MISFLVCIDESGKISDINWSVPAYLVPMRNSLFVDLFPDEEKQIIKGLIEKSITEDGLIKSEADLHLNNQTPRVRLSFLKAANQVLAFAAEDVETINDSCKKEFEEVAHKFMQTIKTYFVGNPIRNNESVGFQFDKIQSLNNDLVNTRRMLEKSNSQLNRLNQDLNNRLVKDALTGLVSRYQYRTEIDFIIASDPNKLGIFTFIDIDDFKKINDRYGHAGGDIFLMELAERLRHLPIENTVKMRIAGDEFGLFTYGLNQAGASETASIWEHIKACVLAEPIIVNGESVPVSISAGMSFYGIDTTEIYDIIEYADFAMYQAKRKGKNSFCRFDQNEYELRQELFYN